MDVSHKIFYLTGFMREYVPDHGNPGGCGAYGECPWPSDFRWETDQEFRDRIMKSLDPAERAR